MSRENQLKNMKYVMLCLLTAVCVWLGAEGLAKAAVVSSSDVNIVHSDEEIQVTSSKQIYYATAKYSTLSLKESYLLPAAKEENGKYLIDFSSISGSKESYIGITNDLTADEKGMVPVTVIKIPAASKKVVFNIDWAEDNAKKMDIFQSILVTNAENTVITYRDLASGETATDTLKSINDLSVEWKKGVNGTWESITSLTAAKWQSCINSKTTVYFRLAADDTNGSRMSKEIKIKATTSSTPSVKIDVSDLSISIKNGMEYRFEGSDKWNTVLPYSSKGSYTAYLLGGKNVFDPSEHITNEKISALTISQLKTAENNSTFVVSGSDLGKPSLGTDGAVTLDIRLAATTKKPASQFKTITIPGQADAPTAQITTATGSTITYTFSSITKAADDIKGESAFECLMIAESDIAKLDMTKASWTSVKVGSKLTSNSKSTFELSDGTRKTYTLSENGVVILLRRKGTSLSSRSEAVLSSEYVKLTVTK